MFPFAPQGTQPLPTSPMFLFFERHVLCKRTKEGVRVPTYEEVISFLPISFFPLGFHEEEAFFSLPLAGYDKPEVQEPFFYEDILIFRSLPTKESVWLMTAWHLWSWYRTHRYCGVCAKPLTLMEKERGLQCTCGNLVFPTIAPAIIVAITDGDYLLMAQNALRAHTPPSLIAGYVEVGEKIEDAVAREVLEEVGLHVTNIQYVANQPWGYTGCQMFGFHANADRHAPLCLQENEIASAVWMKREDVSLPGYPTSVAAHLIGRFAKGEW